MEGKIFDDRLLLTSQFILHPTKDLIVEHLEVDCQFEIKDVRFLIRLIRTNSVSDLRQQLRRRFVFLTDEFRIYYTGRKLADSCILNRIRNLLKIYSSLTAKVKLHNHFFGCQRSNSSWSFFFSMNTTTKDVVSQITKSQVGNYRFYLTLDVTKRPLDPNFRLKDILITVNPIPFEA